MKEYKCISIEKTGLKTQVELNRLAEDGWKLICSYAAHGEWLILERIKASK